MTKVTAKRWYKKIGPKDAKKNRAIMKALHKEQTAKNELELIRNQ